MEMALWVIGGIVAWFVSGIAGMRLVLLIDKLLRVHLESESWMIFLGPVLLLMVVVALVMFFLIFLFERTWSLMKYLAGYKEE